MQINFSLKYSFPLYIICIIIFSLSDLEHVGFLSCLVLQFCVVVIVCWETTMKISNKALLGFNHLLVSLLLHSYISLTIK